MLAYGKESIIRYSNEDTIAAIITPPGEGGLGAIRIAGPRSSRVIDKIFRPADELREPRRPFHLYFGFIVDKGGDIIDEVTMAEMRENRSYTGQRQAEIFCHGGQFVLRRIFKEILKYEVRPAEPGEFTRRAFLSGRIDLARAEAVADLVASKTEYAYDIARSNLLGRLTEQIDSLRNQIVDILAEVEASVDYPEENLEAADGSSMETSIKGLIAMAEELLGSYRGGRIIREGFKIAIAGRPNAGKSSLFNLLLNQNRAIIAPIPGTTRDYLAEWIDLDGYAVQLTDTAGLRGKGGVIERAGQESARKIIEESDLVIWVADVTRKNWNKESLWDLNAFSAPYKLLLINKIDRAKGRVAMNKILSESTSPAIPFSCKTREGLNELRGNLKDSIAKNLPDLTDRLVITSERHRIKLQKAVRFFKHARRGLHDRLSPELIAFEMRQGLNEIDEITGRVYNEQILDRIFSRFCIGK